MKKSDKIKKVLVRNQDDPVGYSGIICSNFEYGFLLLLHILDSYRLNLVFEESSLTLQCLYENLEVQGWYLRRRLVRSFSWLICGLTVGLPFQKRLGMLTI